MFVYQQGSHGNPSHIWSLLITCQKGSSLVKSKQNSIFCWIGFNDTENLEVQKLVDQFSTFAKFSLTKVSPTITILILFLWAAESVNIRFSLHGAPHDTSVGAQCEFIIFCMSLCALHVNESCVRNPDVFRRMSVCRQVGCDICWEVVFTTVVLPTLT